MFSTSLDVFFCICQKKAVPLRTIQNKCHMILYPNCKINIGLHVVRKREDGYHDIETLFVPVYGLHDELEVLPVHDKTNTAKPLNDRLMFTQEGIAVDCPAEDNLIVKCYRRFAAKYPQTGPVQIRFRKNIPFGAGLGGGSSDAAHMAMALNKLFDLGLSQAQLAEEVRPLGADCPFFIYNVPCMAEGTGDILTPVRVDMGRIRIIMVKPTEGVSTREAYAGIIPTSGPSLKEQVINGIQATDIARFPELFANDFEQTVFPKHLMIGEIKKRLLDAGAFYASMSGSGSTVFGLFEHNAEGRSDARLRTFKEEFASMILLDDTLGQRKS